MTDILILTETLHVLVPASLTLVHKKVIFISSEISLHPEKGETDISECAAHEGNVLGRPFATS